MSDSELDEERERLEREADLARERLLSVIETLDRKREELSDPVQVVKREVKRQVARQVEARPEALALVGGGVLLAVGGVAALSIYADRRRQERLARERWAALLRFWKHPEWLAPHKPRRSLFAEVARKLAIGVASVAVVEPVRKAMKIVVGRAVELAVKKAESARASLAGETRRKLEPVKPPLALEAPVVRVDFGDPASQGVLVRGLPR